MYHRITRERLLAFLSALAVFLCIYLLFTISAPFAVWEANKQEFTFNFIDLMPAAVWSWWLAAILAIAVVAGLLPPRLSRVLVSLGIAAFFIFLIEFNFFQGQSALVGAAGEGFDLDTAGSVIPLLIYVPILLVAVLFSRSIVGVGFFAVLVVTAAQLGNALWGSYESEDKTVEAYQERQAAFDSVFRFSGNGDTLQILLDEFQTDYFVDIFNKEFHADPALMPGFVLYKEQLGLFPMTEYALLNVLSGHIYRNDSPRSERDAIYGGPDSIVPAMLRAGRKVDIVDQVGGFEPNPDLKVSRIKSPYLSGTSDEQIDTEVAVLTKIGFDRLVPDRLKALMTEQKDKDTATDNFDVIRDRLTSHSAFFRDFADRIEVVPGKPNYKFIHLLLTHNPAGLDEKCQLTRITTADYVTMRPQTICTMRILFDLFAHMRKLGIYEKTNIVIFADHGRRNALNADKYLEQRRFGEIQSPPRYNYLEAQRIASARPLLMVKPAGSKDPFHISDAPTSYLDIVPTIKDMVGIPLAAGEQSVLNIDQNASRVRQFFYYPYHTRNSEYQDRLVEYAVNGDSLKNQSWTKTGEVLAPGLDFSLTDISMGLDKNRHYEVSGWEVDPLKIRRGGGQVFASTAAPEATIELKFSSAKDHTLAVTMKTEEDFPDQEVLVEVNGKAAGNIVLDPPLDQFKTYEIRIPGRLIDGDPEKLQTLTFRPKRIRSSWTDSMDLRRIAYGVHISQIRMQN